MPYDGLADFLETLEEQGQLARVEVEVDPCGELTEVARRALGNTIDGSPPALLFTRVAGHDWPVVVNLLGSPARLTQALGAESWEELTQRLASTAPSPAPAGLLDRLKRLSAAGRPTPLGAPRIIKTARCQQVVELGRDIDLTALPLPRVGAPGERATMTAGQLFAREPGGTAITVVSAPAVVLEKNQLGLVWHPASELARYASIARQRGETLAVAFTLGACPGWAVAGEVPLPSGWDVYAYAAVLRGAAIELVGARTQPIEVPAESEIVLEGVIDPSADFVPLGSFTVPMGSVATVLAGPRVEITAVTHCANPVLPVRVAGWPWCEAAVLRRTSLRLLLPAARQVVPDLVNLDAPLFAAGRTLFVSISKRFAGQAAQTAAALCGWPPTAGAKFLVIVDDSVDIQDATRVWGQVAAECDPARDLCSFAGPVDPLSTGGAESSVGRVIAIDATRKLPGEQVLPPLPEPPEMAEIRGLVERRWDEYGLAAIAKTGAPC